jgi:cysteine desulfurase
MIYFDYNATTPVLPAARDAWLRASEEFFGNPSSPHRLGSRADAALDGARQKLSRILECDPLDIVWTSGTTESNNTVLHHVAQELKMDEEVWVSAIEHPCVIAPAQRSLGPRLRLIPASKSGVVDLDWLTGELEKRRPRLLAVMAANNETGALQPWPKILELCHRANLEFFCDAAQWIGKMPSSGIGAADWVSGCAHKFGGPKGVGFLKCPRHTMTAPLIMGGEQEDGRRSGTENVPGVLAMVAALEESESRLQAGTHQERSHARDDFERDLRAGMSACEIIATDAPRLWNTSAVLMPQVNCQQRWVVKLDKAGFAVSTGSACASGKEKPSHVLSAMGFAPEDSSRMLRFSTGWETQESDWRDLLEAILATSREIAPR